MPKVIYNPAESSRFGVPEGSYRARFARTEDREPFNGPSKFAKAPSTEPRLEWFFEVVEGEHTGKFITQTTGTTLSGPKAGFTKMVKGLLGRMPTPGEAIDTDEFIGRVYQIEVEVNPASDSGNLHIGFMKPMANGTPSPSPAPSAAPATRPASPSTAAAPPTRVAAPPPPAARPAAPPPTPVERFILWDGTREIELPGPEITQFYKDTFRGPNPGNCEVLRVRKPSEDDWHELKDYRLDEPF